METELGILAVTAASIGFLHTLTGPDHYLPFIVLGRAHRWPLPRTLAVTAVCGVGHVLGSVVLGLVGIALGLAAARLEFVEGLRGGLAAWLLISFGLIYMVWGLRRAWAQRGHPHHHPHGDAGGRLTPWALFIIFVLGPCEPLIPILMYPAAHRNAGALILVTAIFALATIGTMLVLVALLERGINLVPMAKLERYSHVLAGGAICASGMAIRYLGL